MQDRPARVGEIEGKRQKAKGKRQKAKAKAEVKLGSERAPSPSAFCLSLCLSFCLLPFAFCLSSCLQRACSSSGRVHPSLMPPGSSIVPRKPVSPSCMSTACPGSSTTPRSSRRAPRCSTTTRMATSTCTSFRDGGSERRSSSHVRARRPRRSPQARDAVRLPSGGRLFRNDLAVNADGTPDPALHRRHRRERDQGGRLRDGGSGRRLQQRRLRRPVPHESGTRPAVPQQLRRHVHRRVEVTRRAGFTTARQIRNRSGRSRRPFSISTATAGSICSSATIWTIASKATRPASARRGVPTTARRTSTGRRPAASITTIVTGRSPTSRWRPDCRVSSDRRSASSPPISTATAGSISTSPTTASRTSCGSTSATARSRTSVCCRDRR